MAQKGVGGSRQHRCRRQLYGLWKEMIPRQRLSTSNLVSALVHTNKLTWLGPLRGPSCIRAGLTTF